RDEREREPLAHDRDVSRAEERQRVSLHLADVVRHLRRIVGRAGAIGTGDEDHQAVRHDSAGCCAASTRSMRLSGMSQMRATRAYSPPEIPGCTNAARTAIR